MGTGIADREKCRSSAVAKPLTISCHGGPSPDRGSTCCKCSEQHRRHELGTWEVIEAWNEQRRMQHLQPHNNKACVCPKRALNIICCSFAASFDIPEKSTPSPHLQACLHRRHISGRFSPQAPKPKVLNLQNSHTQRMLGIEESPLC